MPNIFLQAAGSGVPIASLETCEEFINQSKAGCFADSNIDLLGDFLQEAWRTPQEEIDSGQTDSISVKRHHEYLKQSKQLAAYLSTIQIPAEGTEIARVA